jgi:hypothetical protein
LAPASASVAKPSFVSFGENPSNKRGSVSLAHKDFVPDEDDIVAEQLRAAGAVMLGKINVLELQSDRPQSGLRNHPQSLEHSAQLRRFARRLGRCGSSRDMPDCDGQ